MKTNKHTNIETNIETPSIEISDSRHCEEERERDQMSPRTMEPCITEPNTMEPCTTEPCTMEPCTMGKPWPSLPLEDERKDNFQSPRHS